MQAARRPVEHREVGHRVRPRPDQVHLAAQHVDELRQLVEAVAPQAAPQARDPLGVVGFPLGVVALDGMHGAELDELEGPPAAAHTLLDEEHGAARVELDGDRDQGEQRQAAHQGQRAQEQAEVPGERELQAGRLEVAGVHDAASRERLEGELAGQPLVRLDRALDVNSSRARLEQQTERQPQPAAQPDDDPVRARPLQSGVELVDVVDDVDDGPAEVMPPADLLDEKARQRARAKNEDPLGGATAPAHAVADAGAEQERHESDEEEQARQEAEAPERRRREQDVEAHAGTPSVQSTSTATLRRSSSTEITSSPLFGLVRRRMPSTSAKGPRVMRTRLPSRRYG